MANKLPVSRLVGVSINLSPLAAQPAGVNSLLVMGESTVLGTSERIRAYSDLDSVAGDFGLDAPEYKAAALYFGQNPRPRSIYIGRWISADAPGFLLCPILTATQQTISNWTAITSGTLSMTVDGAAVSLTGIDLHTATNLNGVAALLNTALAGAATVEWDGQRWRIISPTTGPTSTVSAATGTVATLMRAVSGSATPVAGAVAETPAEAVAELDDRFGRQWYAVMFAVDGGITDLDSIAVSEYIQATNHIYGITGTDTVILDAITDTDIGSVLKASGYTRTVGQYSENPYAVASYIGRNMVVNFAGNNTTITGMFKQEPGVIPENLTATQANTLQSKRWNVFAEYDNDTAIIQYGTMFGPAYFDEIHCLDAMALDIQTAVYNALYTSPTKIPQTDAGIHLLETVITEVLARYVANGTIAKGGVWKSAGFGTLNYGDVLHEGYYIYAQSVADQLQADREARKSPPIQIAVKLAGAVHTVDASILVNR